MINERTIQELVEKLQQVDEMTILELLDLSSEELPLFLLDVIEERYDILIEYFNEEDNNE